MRNEDKALVSLHESVFWDKGDHRYDFMYPDGPTHHKERGAHIVNFGEDSYICCFTGWRGAGKSTGMAFFGLKSVYLYNMRLVSNFDIACRINYMNGKSKIIHSEPLDLYKLLCFDEDYQNCLILIDEAPDIVSHLAAMTWKNRLLNIFIRQLRKNGNTLFLGAQQFELIDRSMRWQTDLVFNCADASRKYSNNNLGRGECVLISIFDNSGMTTGQSTQERINQARYTNQACDGSIVKLALYPRCLWGDDAHKPVFDSWFQTDVWESLRKVDIKLSSYKVGNNSKEVEMDDIQSLENAGNRVAQITDSEEKRVFTDSFFNSLGSISDRDKQLISKRLAKAGIRKGQSGNGKRFYDFEGFDVERFLRGE